MPNHVHNVITINADAETLLKIRTALISKAENGKEFFDFNKLVPMPDYIFRGPLGEAEMKQYGENNWYDWSLNNWGTKWNAYDCEISDDGSWYEFNTAWGAPNQIYEAIANRFPDVEITVKYAVEFLGEYSGCMQIKNGTIVHVNMSMGAPGVTDAKAIEFACEVWGDKPEDYGLILNEKTGKYECEWDDAEGEGE